MIAPSSRGIDVKSAMIASGICLFLVAMGLFTIPIHTLSYNVVLFTSVSIMCLWWVAKHVKSGDTFVGFNKLLTILLKCFTIMLSIYLIGFMVIEWAFGEQMVSWRQVISEQNLKRIKGKIEEDQYLELKDAVMHQDMNEWSLTSVFINFSLYFAIIGLPLGILVAAIMNKGFSNVPKIERNDK